jgi:putative ABC transport system permease protein
MHYDEYFGYQFREIERSRSIFFYFAFIAILIACLGLYGMTSFKTERRTKEIGIRKVLGGSVNSIILLLNKDLIRSIIIASMGAYPLAFYFSTKWLADFPFRIELTALPFILSTLLVFIVGILVTVSLTVRAATSNPVNLLRYE